MGRKRLPEEQLRKRISIRLEQKDIDKIKQVSTLQNFIEKAIKEKLDKT